MLAGAVLLDERPRATIICLLLALPDKEESILIALEFGGVHRASPLALALRPGAAGHPG